MLLQVSWFDLSGVGTGPQLVYDSLNGSCRKTTPVHRVAIETET